MLECDCRKAALRNARSPFFLATKRNSHLYSYTREVLSHFSSRFHRSRALQSCSLYCTTYYILNYCTRGASFCALFRQSLIFFASLLFFMLYYVQAFFLTQEDFIRLLEGALFCYNCFLRQIEGTLFHTRAKDDLNVEGCAKRFAMICFDFLR